MGVRVSKQFATMGEYDFVTFIDAPSNEHVAKASVELASLGTMKLTTLPSIEVDRFQKLLSMEPYRTEPHVWQTSLWARAVRRTGRYWTTTRYVRRYCKPLSIEGQDNLKGFKGGAIVIANHSSHFDSPVVYSSLPSHIRNKLMMAAAADKFYASRKKRVVVAVALPGRVPRAPWRRHEAARVSAVAAQARLLDPDLPGGRPIEVGADRALQGRPGDHGDGRRTCR